MGSNLVPGYSALIHIHVHVHCTHTHTHTHAHSHTHAHTHTHTYTHTLQSECRGNALLSITHKPDSGSLQGIVLRAKNLQKVNGTGTACEYKWNQQFSSLNTTRKYACIHTHAHTHAHAHAHAHAHTHTHIHTHTLSLSLSHSLTHSLTPRSLIR